MSTAPPSAAPPGPHPEPPTDLAARRLTLHRLAPGTELFRVHPVRYAHDLRYFGRTSAGRFNAPGGEYGTLYAALDPYAAFLETFARHVGVQGVSGALLAENLLVRLTPKAPLQLVDLAGAALRRMGADARITTGDYGVAQRWALALWRYRPRPDGLYWRSRFDTTRFAVALFDHAAPAVDATIVGGWDERAQAPLLAAILDAYDLALL